MPSTPRHVTGCTQALRASSAIASFALTLCGVALALSCAGSDVQRALRAGRVDQAIAAQREPDELARIASHVLIEEARQSEPSARSAWAALRGLGSSASEAWDALDHEPGDHFSALVRAQVLAARSSLGDAVARRSLRELVESPDLELVALAIEGLDGEGDAETLTKLARSSSAEVRAAAVGKLARPSATLDTRLLLEEIARIDPTDNVRATALRGLSSIDFERAEPQVAELLKGPPSMRSLEVAQDVLLRIARAQMPAPSEVLEHQAKQQLERAFAGKDRALRGRAATALMAITSSDAAPALRGRIAARLESEKDRPQRLLLALALGVQDARGRAALQALAKGKDVPAAQAAAQLARSQDASTRAQARDQLRVLMQSPQAAVRSSTAPALARLYDFKGARAALLDQAPRVRIATAAALLRAVASLEPRS